MSSESHLPIDAPREPAAPLAPPQKSPDLPPRSRFVKHGLTVCGVLVVLIVCTQIYRRATAYGSRVVQSHPIDARIEISNPPPWLDHRIVDALLDEAYRFAQKDFSTYDRTRNILDTGVLREFADLFTATDTTGDQNNSRQAVGFNAWIRQVKEVRRNIARDKSVQTIQITAEWRKPAAWVHPIPGSDSVCLIDAEGVRLPGDYHLADRTGSPLMVITGIEFSTAGGQPAIPQPGERWIAGKSDALGGDLMAGLQLTELLQTQPFSQQISAINLANFAGRKNPLSPWISLETLWPAADGSPRRVEWGRPIGQEAYYEVKAAQKLKALSDLYLHFNRIDAGRDYVDIRTEVIRLPKLATAN